VDEICDAWRPAPLVSTQDLAGVVPRREPLHNEFVNKRILLFSGNAYKRGGRAKITQDVNF